MDSKYETADGNLTKDYAMEVVFLHHSTALLCVILGSLILGLPLAWNILWHLKESLCQWLWFPWLEICHFPNKPASGVNFSLVIAYFLGLQIATGARGRGVLRLLLIRQQINLLCIPAICLQLCIVAFPSASLPPLLCLILEVLLLIVSTNGTIGHITIALGRYSPERFDMWS